MHILTNRTEYKIIQTKTDLSRNNALHELQFLVNNSEWSISIWCSVHVLQFCFSAYLPNNKPDTVWFGKTKQ